jgi:hypothetical protein
MSKVGTQKASLTYPINTTCNLDTQMPSLAYPNNTVSKLNTQIALRTLATQWINYTPI